MYQGFKLLVFNAFSALGIYLMPVQDRAMAIMVLVAIDLITGISASVARSRRAKAAGGEGEKITSRRMRDSVTKFIGYSIALISSHIFTTHFGVDIFYVVAFYLAAVELKSVMENLSVILNNDLYQTVVAFLAKKFKELNVGNV